MRVVPSTVPPLAPFELCPIPQMTYSLTRFAIYETVRDQVAQGSQGPLPFYKKVLLGSISGEQLADRGPGGGREGRRWCAQAGLPGHCVCSHTGSCVCRPRLHRRFRGHSCGHGQRQVSVVPRGQGLSCVP